MKVGLQLKLYKWWIIIILDIRGLWDWGRELPIPVTHNLPDDSTIYVANVLVCVCMYVNDRANVFVLIQQCRWHNMPSNVLTIWQWYSWYYDICIWKDIKDKHFIWKDSLIHPSLDIQISNSGQSKLGQVLVLKRLSKQELLESNSDISKYISWYSL